MEEGGTDGWRREIEMYGEGGRDGWRREVQVEGGGR